MKPVTEVIPHRPPFLFIDEVIELADDGAVSRHTVRADAPHFEGHYPGNPIMPGVLLCEAVFQTSAYFLVEKKFVGDAGAESVTPVLVRITDARFKRMVVPGDEIEIHVRYKEAVGKFHFMTGKALKGGKPAATLEFALALVEKDSE